MDAYCTASSWNSTNFFFAIIDAGKIFITDLHLQSSTCSEYKQHSTAWLHVLQMEPYTLYGGST